VALAHNGNLVNAARLRRELQEQGTIFTSTSDTEVVLHLFARSRETDLVERLASALRRAEGAFSMLLLAEDKLVGVRDPRGFRPLILGRKQGAHVLASETCALDLIEAEYVREILPGEVVVADREGVRSFFPFEKQQPARCVFEHIYFARPDSVLYGASVYATRTEMGRRLAEEQPAQADLVVPVPDSGVPAAIGYAEKSGIPFGMGLVRSHYVGRTFIEPQQSIRHFGVKLKLNALGGVLEGKRIVVVDDSLVRGTTSRKIVAMLRSAGAKEVHLRISSPPTTWPCYYGIDTPTREELIASSSTVPEIAGYVDADSLGYLSVEGMHAAVGGDGPASYCDACFTGNYRVPVTREERSRPLRVLDA
jgi:amidophosphoribosyltransferase